MVRAATAGVPDGHRISRTAAELPWVFADTPRLSGPHRQVRAVISRARTVGRAGSCSRNRPNADLAMLQWKCGKEAENDRSGRVRSAHWHLALDRQAQYQRYAGRVLLYCQGHEPISAGGEVA